jgi:hypothetical protein
VLAVDGDARLSDVPAANHSAKLTPQSIRRRGALPPGCAPRGPRGDLVASIRGGQSGRLSRDARPGVRAAPEAPNCCRRRTRSGASTT